MRNNRMELSLLLFVVFSLCLSYQAKLFSSPTIARRARNRKDDRNQFKKLVLLRAGSTLMESKEYEDNSVPCTVIVSTLFGSEFLDKKKKFILRNTTTIAELKEQIQSKFPGSPPKEMQRLFFGTNRILSDNDILGNITTTTQVTLVLDMTTGTSVYNKTMSIRQTIDAYVASTTQLSYISAMMKQLMNSESNLSNSSEMETTQLRNLYRALNQTIYESKSNAIALALEREKNPEYESEDTKPWRLQKKKALSPVWTAFAKEFDLNTRGLINLVYYSLAVLIFAVFGAPTTQTKLIMLALIPFAWISKLRQIRLLYKILLYSILPICLKLDFFLKLLPAPYQVIAEHTRSWLDVNGEENSADDSESEENDRIDSKGKGNENDEDDDDDNDGDVDNDDYEKDDEEDEEEE